MLADALGRPLRFILTAGQVHDITRRTGASQRRRPATHVIADKAYDSSALRQIIADIGARRHPLEPLPKGHQSPTTPTLYKARNRIERCFNKLKHFRRFATRFDRRAVHFLAFIHLASRHALDAMNVDSA